jgi:2-iminoacetate synthase
LDRILGEIIVEDFINDNRIEEILEKAAKPERSRVEEIIAKAKELKGLTPEETAVLLQTEDPDLLSMIFATAKEIKDTIYGKRLVIFAPLYISNYCANNCLYCGFRTGNTDLHRVALTMEQISDEVKVLEREGHKRILMLCGEHPKRSGIDYFVEAIETVYATKTEKGGEIRRINVEIAPLEVDEFRRLKRAGIGTYVLFQETYHHATFKSMHPSGPKADYLWRLTAMDRAQQGGVDDVGIGSLFGLHDYKFEVLGLLYHAQHLESRFGVGPHTISIPRLEIAANAPAAILPPAPVADHEFKKLIACIRMAVPYTGIILSTRENPEMRAEAYELGVSQISAGSRTNPGGYFDKSGEGFSAGQFNLGDTRTTDEVIYDITTRGFIPSFCTACYRLGRTGMDFMDLAKPGLIRKFCNPNAILTFKEYLIDFASPRTRKAGEELIAKLIEETDDTAIRRILQNGLQKIEQGERDICS